MRRRPSARSVAAARAAGPAGPGPAGRAIRAAVPVTARRGPAAPLRPAADPACGCSASRRGWPGAGRAATPHDSPRRRARPSGEAARSRSATAGGGRRPHQEQRFRGRSGVAALVTASREQQRHQPRDASFARSRPTVDDVLGLRSARGPAAPTTNPRSYNGPDLERSGDRSPHAARDGSAGAVACRVLLGRLVKYTKGAQK